MEPLAGIMKGRYKEFVDKCLLMDEGGYPGLKDLLVYLEAETDFFSAPASSKFHLSVPHGLFIHSTNVFNVGINLMMFFPRPSFTEEEWCLASFFHDLCKTNYYSVEPAWRKDDKGKWESYFKGTVDDKFPMGHGEKSLYILNKFIKVKDEIALAIRWHMGKHDLATHHYQSSGAAFNQASSEYSLVKFLQIADAATSLIETENAFFDFDSGKWIQLLVDSRHVLIGCKEHKGKPATENNE